MLSKFLAFLFTLILFSSAFGQEERNVTEALPNGGVERLAAIYHRIQLSEAQKGLLSIGEIQLLFKVSRQGEAQLYKTQGVWNKAVMDSLFSRNDSLPSFEPRMTNGFSESSFYALGLRFPDGFTCIPQSEIEYDVFDIKISIDDLEFVERGGRAMSFSFGAAGSVLNDDYSKYYDPGYGFYIEMAIHRKKIPHAFVLRTGFLFHQISTPPPIEPGRELADPMSHLITDVGYAFFMRNNSFTPYLSSIRSYTSHSEEDEKSLQEIRYGIGFAYTRNLPIIKEKFIYGIEGPVLIERGVSVTLRPTYYFVGSDLFERGAMFSLLIGYYSGSQRVTDYRFKESFYE